MSSLDKPRIAVFSGPTATIGNSQPLITSNKARAKYGLWSRRSSIHAASHPGKVTRGRDFEPGAPLLVRMSAAVTSSMPRGQRRFSGSATSKDRRPIFVISMST